MSWTIDSLQGKPWEDNQDDKRGIWRRSKLIDWANIGDRYTVTSTIEGPKQFGIFDGPDRAEETN